LPLGCKSQCICFIVFVDDLLLKLKIIVVFKGCFIRKNDAQGCIEFFHQLLERIPDVVRFQILNPSSGTIEWPAIQIVDTPALALT